MRAYKVTSAPPFIYIIQFHRSIHTTYLLITGTDTAQRISFGTDDITYIYFGLSIINYIPFKNIITTSTLNKVIRASGGGVVLRIAMN